MILALRSRPCRNRPAARGFTLTELVIVLAIAAVLTVVAAPSLTAMVRNNRLDTAANRFIAALASARMEALKQAVQVNVANVGGTTDWSRGWTIAAANATANLQVGEAQPAPMTFVGTADTSAGFGFSPAGRLVVGTQIPAPPLVFVFCADGSNLAHDSRAVLVSSSGRVSMAHLSASGIPLKDDGTTVNSCAAP